MIVIGDTTATPPYTYPRLHTPQMTLGRRRISTLCMLLACSTTPLPSSASLPLRSGSGAEAAAVSQFTKLATTTSKQHTNVATKKSKGSTVDKQTGIINTSRSSSNSTGDDVTRIASSTAAASTPNTQTSTLSQHQQHSSVAIGLGTGGTLSIIQNAIHNSAGPIFRSITFGAQLAIATYLAKASWKIMREIWDELNEEYRIHYKEGKSGGDTREEQDMPFADEDALLGGFGEYDGENDNLDGNFAPHTKQRRRDKATPQMTATRELAARLRSAGIPYASEVEDDDNSNNANPRTVETIVKSLTRSEGNVLSQTLLTPMDGGLVVGSKVESEAAAAEAWNAIGGLVEAKESLLDLAFPLLPSQSTSSQSDTVESNDYYGGLLANPPGVLLYGPPGCGKSMLVRALAATVGARFLVVSPSCLLRKYVGETNLNVRALFSVARKISPCVIFVDELDGLFRERGGEDHDVGRDLKTEFLQLWDGIRRNNSRSGGTGGLSSVLVIGATNRPFDVDPAFLRRMPRRVFVGLPDYNSRVAVLSNMLRRVPLDANFDKSLLASKTGGYSPSDIREVLQAAALYPLREARAAAVSSSMSGGGNGDSTIPIKIQMPPLRRLRTDDVLRALEIAKPTHFSKKYQRDLMEYVRNSGGARGFDYAGDNSPTVDDFDSSKDDSFFIADAGTFNSDYFNQVGGEDESDPYAYDESESEYDDDDL